MKHIRQILLILTFSAVGELLHGWIPLPIPASVYGLVLLFLSLQCRLIKAEAVQQTGEWMISVLPIFFVAPGVSILACWDVLAPKLVPLTIVMISVTVLTFLVSGKATQRVLKGRNADA